MLMASRNRHVDMGARATKIRFEQCVPATLIRTRNSKANVKHEAQCRHAELHYQGE
jgi:hypothetical protein